MGGDSDSNQGTSPSLRALAGEIREGRPEEAHPRGARVAVSFSSFQKPPAKSTDLKRPANNEGKNKPREREGSSEPLGVRRGTHLEANRGGAYRVEAEVRAALHLGRDRLGGTRSRFA